MSGKHLLFEAQAREKVLRGATALYDAVRVTLGPKSKCVLIGKKWGTPLVCNDGVTIAKEMELEDVDENLGVQMLRQAAERTGEAVGDGTSTATILAYSIFAEGLRNIAAGASGIDIKRGLDRGAAAVATALRGISRPITGRREKEQVATISAHNDPSIGGVVAEAMERVGAEGVISVEEAKATETTIEVVEGLQFDRGYLSPYFLTDAGRGECILEDALVFLHDRKVAGLKDLLPLLEAVAKEGKPLLIIAEDVEADALATLVVNRVRGTLACCAVKSPGFGDRRKEMLEDIAILTGGQVISEERGRQLRNVTLDDLGRVRRVVITHDDTTLVGGSGDRLAIQQRTDQLRRQIEQSDSEYDKEKLQERLGKLTGGVAVIHVGAPSEAELKSRKEALEDAIAATKAAVAEGIVPGGGLALLRLREAIEREEAAVDGDVRTGLRILAHALEAPARQIAENSGMDPGVAVERMKGGDGHLGFDAARGVFVDLLDAGIIDPTKVVRIALENAVSVASVLLLTEAIMTERPEPKQARQAEAGLM
jgi:chaperonin GroEL